MEKPAARVGDRVEHPQPPQLTGGPGSPNVMIGGSPAWRGIPAASANALQQIKSASDSTIQAAEAATLAAQGTLGYLPAKAAESATKLTASLSMGQLVWAIAAESTTTPADVHQCDTPLPLPPHGPGVVIDGSPTVLINGLPAAREGDTILEALGGPNRIQLGCATVLIGDAPMLGTMVDGTMAIATLQQDLQTVAVQAADQVRTELQQQLDAARQAIETARQARATTEADLQAAETLLREQEDAELAQLSADDPTYTDRLAEITQRRTQADLDQQQRAIAETDLQAQEDLQLQQQTSDILSQEEQAIRDREAATLQQQQTQPRPPGLLQRFFGSLFGR